MHPFRGGCVLGQQRKKVVAWPVRALNTVTAKGQKRMLGDSSSLYLVLLELGRLSTT
jgi:hypothetical protein